MKISIVAAFILVAGFSAQAADSVADAVTGKALFVKDCSMCHMAAGEGLAGVFPPVAKSDYFKNASNEQLVKIITSGLMGEITVNGNKYNSVMSPIDLTDAEIASVVNYVSVELNAGKPLLTAEKVKTIRAGQ